MRREVVNYFIKELPDALGVYGYGSANFVQKGYTPQDHPEIDLIVVVDDIVKWSRENAAFMSKLYTIWTKTFFASAKDNYLNDKCSVYCLLSVPFNGFKFKMLVIDDRVFRSSLLNYSCMIPVARTQKLIETYKSNDEYDHLIDYNRRSAALSGLILSDGDISFRDLLIEICGLTYMGDLRMKYGEKPTKVVDLVDGSFELYKELYTPYIEEFTTIDNDIIKYRDSIVSNKFELPAYLRAHIGFNYDPDDIRFRMMDFFVKANKEASEYLIKNGFMINGPTRSIPYGARKVLKRFKK